jgi:hypothetical protein
MDVHVAEGVRRLQPGFHFAVTCLLPDADGSEIGRDVLVDLNTKCLAYPLLAVALAFPALQLSICWILVIPSEVRDEFLKGVARASLWTRL